MGKRLETLLSVQEVQQASKAFTRETGCTDSKQIYESAIMKQFQIGYSTYYDYMREENVPEQIAAYQAEKQQPSVSPAYKPGQG